MVGSNSEIGSAVVKKLLAAGHQVIQIDTHDADINVDFSNTSARLEAIERVTENCSDAIDAIISTIKMPANKPQTISSNYFGITQFIEGLSDELNRSSAPRVCILNYYQTSDQTSPDLINLILNSGEKVSLRYAQEVLERSPKLAEVNFASSQKALQMWVQAVANEKHWKTSAVLINTVTSDNRTSINDTAELLIWLSGPMNKTFTGQVFDLKNNSTPTFTSS